MNEIDMTKNSKKPIDEVKMGAVRVAIWNNTITKNDRQIPIKSVSISKLYLSGKEWKPTSSLDINDIPKAIMALTDVYKKLVVEKSNLGST